MSHNRVPSTRDKIIALVLNETRHKTNRTRKPHASHLLCLGRFLGLAYELVAAGWAETRPKCSESFVCLQHRLKLLLRPLQLLPVLCMINALIALIRNNNIVLVYTTALPPKHADKRYAPISTYPFSPTKQHRKIRNPRQYRKS